MDVNEMKLRIIQAGQKAVKELKIIGVYKQNFDNKPSEILKDLTHEK